MNIYGLEDNKTEFRALSDKVISIYNLHGFENEASAIKNEVDIQLEKVRPSMMFYGVYNSGKSSVINALAGEYIAEVGDVPTTNKVEHIKWQGFMLTDTPGIVANDEHTRIAEEEIKRHDVILFVIDDMGTFENCSVTKAIVNIIKVGKPIIIVINQKQASEEGVYTKQVQGKIMPKIIENIRIESQKIGIPFADKAKNFCGIIPVNAMSAYMAKTQYKNNSESSQKLLTECGVDELTAAIREELQKTSGVKILLSAIQIVQSSIKDVHKNLKNNLQPGIEKAYYEAVNSVNEQKSSLYCSIFNIGKNEILSYGDKIYASAVRGEQVNDFAKQLNENLKKIILGSFANANITLINQFEFYQASFGDDYKIDFSKISSIKLELPNKLDDNEDFDLWDIIKDILDLSQDGEVYSKAIMYNYTSAFHNTKYHFSKYNTYYYRRTYKIIYWTQKY